MNDNRLCELKEERNLKSKEVAQYLGVYESTYSEWEHNKIPIPTKRLIQMANFYEVNIDYMIKISNERKHIPKNEDIDLKEIGKRIKAIRINLGLSLRSLGDELNTAFSSLASYERGEHLIQSETLIALAKLSNTSIDYILSRD